MGGGGIVAPLEERGTALKPLWGLAGVALLGVTGAAGAVIIATSGGEEEVVQQVATGTASVAPTTTRSASPSPTTVTPSAAATTQPSPDGVPTDWQTYTDPVLGFSLRYPGDLTLEDLTPSRGTGGRYERVLDARSPTDSGRAVSVEVIANPDNVSPRDWALAETACIPDSIEDTSIAGQPAVSCIEQATETPHPTVLFGHQGRMFEIGSLLMDSEFDLVIGSLQVEST
jgi:hypothetical protein